MASSPALTRADVTRRRRTLLAAGLVDSLGLAIGWTTISLQAVHADGMQALGTLSAAMLVGVALSAPFTGWLAARVDGRALLRGTAAGEAVGRAAAFGLMFTGAPLWLVAAIIGVCNVIAWTGFAGMRAEIALVGDDDGNARWLSAYTASIAAAEALGAFVAAFLPLDPAGLLRSDLVAVVGVLYAASLIPTFLVARDAQAPVARTGSPRAQLRGRGRLLVGGGLVTLVGTGPMLLAVGLADGLHGRGAVGPAMLCFAVGSLLGPALAEWVRRIPSPTPVVWGFLGALMLVGWGVAPLAVAGLLVAQLVSGLALGAFEGVMDAEVAETGDHSCVTSAMAWAGATRAIGSAVAVAAVPLAMASSGVARTTAAGTLLLVGAAVVAGFGGLVRGLGAAWRGRREDEWISWQDLPPRWVVLVAGTSQEEAELMVRCPDAEVFVAADGDELLAIAGETVGPDMIMVGRRAGDDVLLAVEALVSPTGPWRNTFVRIGEQPRPPARPELVVVAAA